VTRLYYLGVNNSCMDARVVSAKYVVGRGYTGVTFTTKLAPGYDYVGEFVAFNPATGARAWTYRPPSGAAMTASALATGGGIVFGGTADRQLFALHSETGELLWQTRLSGDVSGAPVTFEVGGRQYLAIGVGGRTGPTTSFAPLTNTDLSQGTGVLTVFALPADTDTTLSSRGRSRPVLMSASGGQPPPAAPAAAANVAAAAGPPRGSSRSAMEGVFTIAQASRGEQHFKQACESCHQVAEQTGTTFNAKWGGGTLADVFTTISKTMPQGQPGSLTADAYSSIVAFYLRESGFPAGAAELPADPVALTNVRVK
jgi:mono/diheme cytochrome c family protein